MLENKKRNSTHNDNFKKKKMCIKKDVKPRLSSQSFWLIFLIVDVVYGRQAVVTGRTEIREGFVSESCGQRLTCGKACDLSQTIKFTDSMPNVLFLNFTLLVYKCKKELGRCYTGKKMDFKLNGNGRSFFQDLPNYDYSFGTENSTSVTSLVLINLLSYLDEDRKLVIKIYSSSEFCGLFESVNHYYYMCPDDGANELVRFEQVYAPSEGNYMQTDGECIENAVPYQKTPNRKCWYNGTYSIQGNCVCKPNYERKGNSCQACQSEYFKTAAGDDTCKKCGNYSIQNGGTNCKCYEGYARIKNEADDVEKPCYGLPKVNGLTFNKTENQINLFWQPSVNVESLYEVLCEECPGTWPKQVGQSTELLLSNLTPYTDYTVTVIVLDNITQLTGETLRVTHVIKTNPGPPSEVKNISEVQNTGGIVVITWDEPLIKGADTIIYLIEYDGKLLETSKRTLSIPSVVKSKTYVVKITPVSVFNNVRRSGPEKTINVAVDGKGVPLSLLLGSIGGAIALLLVFVIVVIILWRRKHPSHLQVYRMEDGTVQLQRNRLFSTGRVYVDPTTYSVVDDAVYEFTLELNHKNLSMNDLIGNGEFADVYKGVLMKNGVEQVVAVKTLKSSATRKDRDDFVSEAAILGQFQDSNVVSLEGVILKDYPNVLVLEYMANGSLDKYLQSNDGKFSIMTLLGMARGVASGMRYLSELGFIHRDLAARNVLVNKQDTCKIADFGMSRELKTDETYDTRGGKIPIKWTAPEAIEFKKFTTASDVWSYGILLWEIMSYSVRPYWNWANYEVLERLATGYRLPPPQDCPKVVHDLMLQCWHKDRTKRPKFTMIRESIEEWIRYPDLLKDFASVVTKSDENIDYTAFSSVAHWLESIKMEQYTPNFKTKGYLVPKDIILLQLEDLEQIGVETIGHRKKIFKAVTKTRQQVEEHTGTRTSTSTAPTEAKVSRSTSSAGAFKNALTKKLSFGVKNHGYDKSSLNKEEMSTLTDQSSFSCV